MPRVLIFVVAYNAESTIESVLQRIPADVLAMDTEVLVIDDRSGDRTFERAEAFRKAHAGVHLTVLFNPVNQGYGGNQKIGYQYALDRGFDAVVLLHGDGQYAPERMPDLLRPILEGRAEAVFGSRMMPPGSALRGGMPLYKFAGNRILTRFQNALLRSRLSEFHSGYRAYAVRALASIPFAFNSNDFHFDTEIIVQLMMKGHRIAEVPIPTYYGTEICRVNGLRYAWNVARATVGARLHAMGLFYRRNYDVQPPGAPYPLKLGYVSSHTLAMDAVPPGASVLDVGCGGGEWGAELKRRKGCRVVGVDERPEAESHRALDGYIRCDLNRGDPGRDSSGFDVVTLLDVLEHLDTPAQMRLLASIRERAGRRAPLVLVSVPNVAFVVTRVMLMLGQFNYGRRGILDITHRHLFTRASLLALLHQAGYRVHRIRAIPPPYPEALGPSRFGRFLTRAHDGAARLMPSLLAYQFLVAARPLPTVHHLLETALTVSRERSGNGPTG
jgi:glycosyltransferase involved in cell wall biosynthesis